jgi:hypothetical protein
MAKLDRDVHKKGLVGTWGPLVSPPPLVHMPRRSRKQELLLDIHAASNKAHKLRAADLQQQQVDAESTESDTNSSTNSFDDGLPGFILSSISPMTPMTPMTPLFLLFNTDSESELDSDSSLESEDGYVSPTSHYDCFINAIAALEEEVLRAHVLYKPLAPLMHAPQIHLLAQCKDHPEGFHNLKKVGVDHDIFDDILDQIIDHPIFHSGSQPISSFLSLSSLLSFSTMLDITVMQFLSQMLHYGQKWVMAHD